MEELERRRRGRGGDLEEALGAVAPRRRRRGGLRRRRKMEELERRRRGRGGDLEEAVGRRHRGGDDEAGCGGGRGK
jgi:hypothetical protein